MKEYFAREKISFSNTPALYPARLLLVALLVISGNYQWIIILFGTAFSIGFIYLTEIEYMLPLTDKELRDLRFRRVGIVWLRYLIFGLIGRVFAYIASTRGWGLGREEICVARPYIVLAHFILLMIYAYELMLDSAGERKPVNKAPFFIKKEKIKYLTETLPHLVFFVYSMGIMLKHGIARLGSEWIHVAILLAAAVILLVNVIISRSKWRLGDYVPSVMDETVL